VFGETDLHRLDEVLATSPIAIVAWNSDRRISFWSKRAEAIFGWTADETLGKTTADFCFVHPDDKPHVDEIQVMLDAGTVPLMANENRNYRKDGTLLQCTWFTGMIQDDDRFHTISLVEDVSATHHAREQRVETEVRFRSLFQFNPDPVMIFGRDGRIIDVNAAIVRFGEAPREQIIGRHFTDFLYPEDHDQNARSFGRAINGETIFYETKARTIGGRRLDIVITTVPMFQEGKIEGAFSILRDVTSEREAARHIREQERALSESAQSLRSLFVNFPDGVLAVNAGGVIEDANDAYMQIGGYDRAGILGRSIFDFTLLHDRERLELLFARALAGETVIHDLNSVSADGATLEVHATWVPRREGGEVCGIYAIIQDVTEQRAAERRVERAATRVRDLYDIAANEEFSDVRLSASLAFGCDAFGYGSGAIVNTTEIPRIEARHTVDGRDALDEHAALSLANAAMQQTERNDYIVSRNGIAMRLLVGGEPFGAIAFVDPDRDRLFEETDADLLGFIATLLGGTIDRHRSRTHLRTLAYSDTLTGLPNRVYLHERLREAIEVAPSRLSRVAILFLDLDRFKDVNETLGHARGDRLLQFVAQRLQHEVGERAVVARTGGDEFVVLVPDCQEREEIRDLADRLLVALSEPFPLDDYEQFVSTSIGIAVYPEDGADDQTLVKNADIAMYRAKDRGRNGYFFYNPSLEAPIQMRISQERLLRRALERGEFVVYYQPLIEVATGKIVSVEALVRWRHPKSGLIEPSDFIPSAEISGLIVPLGDWVLSEAAKQMATWQKRFGPLRLAVNLSARQFHQRDLRVRVLSALADAGLDPHFLEIEITESVAMSDADTTVAIVRDFKNSGVRTVVDDFGTGYSSLSYLRRFDLDVLKIDRSFVAGIGVQPSDETIVRAVIAMSHSLGLEVVAEGVETEAQMAFLREHACDVVQGFLLSRPLPAAEALTFLARHRQDVVAPG
jgi:diguanylate cyclase (GGDEF)-like protein/PAS domain S-box-containing protein